MAKNDGGTSAATAGKAKKERKAMVQKPILVVFQVLDEDHQPMPFPKERINFIVATKDSIRALEIMDSKENAYSTYKVVRVDPKSDLGSAGNGN